MTPQNDYRFEPARPSPPHALVDRDLVAETNRLFERPGLVNELLDLLDNKMLQGGEVETYKYKIAPPANASLLTGKGGVGDTAAVGQSPEVRVEYTAGWHDVDLYYESRTVLFVPGVDLTEVADQLRETALSHYVWIDGKAYLIKEVLNVFARGSVIQLVEPIESALASRQTFKGTIYNGAHEIAIKAVNRKTGKSISVKWDSAGLAPNHNIPFTVPPGDYTVGVVFISPSERRRFTYALEIDGLYPLLPDRTNIESITITSKVFSPRESGDALGFTDLRRSFAVEAKIQRLWRLSEKIASVEATFSLPGRAPNKVVRPLTPAQIELQERTGDPVTIRTFLGASSLWTGPVTISIRLISSTGRELATYEKSFVDLLPTVTSDELLPDPIPESLGPVYAHSVVSNTALREAFASLLEVSAQPLSIDPQDIRDLAKDAMDELEGYAETLVRSSIAGDVLIDNPQ